MLKYRHILTRSQCIQSVYEFLDELQVIQLQLLDRRHYDAIIPLMLYQLINTLGSRLVCWQFESIVVIDVLTRRKHFYSHFKLERQHSAFAVIGLRFVLFGGNCPDHNSLHTGKDASVYQIIPYLMDPKTDNAEKMFQPLPEARM